VLLDGQKKNGQSRTTPISGPRKLRRVDLSASWGALLLYNPFAALYFFPRPC